MCRPLVEAVFVATSIGISPTRSVASASTVGSVAGSTVYMCGTASAAEIAASAEMDAPWRHFARSVPPTNSTAIPPSPLSFARIVWRM